MLFITSIAVVASAQERHDSLDVSKRLDNVTVRAERAARPVTSAAPLHIIDAQRMKVSGVADIADAIHRLPGITLRDYGGAGGLKTVSVRGFGASHTGVLYDGLPLNDAQSGQIDVSRYSLDNVASLSMAIGDNDDIFIPARSAASAATLSISTLPPQADSLSVTGQLRFGAWNFINPFFRIVTPMGEKVSVAAAGEFTHADNDYPFTLQNITTTTRERRNNSRMNSGHAEVNTTWQITPRSSLTAKAYYYDNARRLPGPVIYYNNVCHERLRETNAFGQATYRSVIGSKWSLRASGKFDFSRSLYHDEDGKYPGGELNQNYYQREAYATATALWLPDTHWSLAYAADYAYNTLTSNLPDNNRPTRNSILQSLTGRWRSRRLTVMGRILASLYLNGTRTGQSASDARRLSPSLSLSVQPLREENFFIRLSYKEIFRPPTFNEAYFDHYGSTDLKPENTSQINIGLTWSPKPMSWLPSATITLDGYVNHVSDMIVGIPYNMFVWRMVNLDKVRVFGLDATMAVTFVPRKGQTLLLTGNYSFQRAEPRTDPTSTEWMKQVAYIPRHSGTISLGWTNPWVNLAWHTTGVSARYTTNNNLPETRIAGYAESGVTIWRQFIIGHRNKVELRADILNLFDKQYEVVARYPMPGRSWQVTLKYQL
ncbi:MAG: TonB-dependent receptor [Alloprevotella sp.]|nr:TonB-dependent receptor [Alloprevotella sp.]